MTQISAALRFPSHFSQYLGQNEIYFAASFLNLLQHPTLFHTVQQPFLENYPCLSRHISTQLHNYDSSVRAHLWLQVLHNPFGVLNNPSSGLWNYYQMVCDPGQLTMFQ
uniref:Uncharacterized protein n=1 Tax=Opuntia streptacantha TaxID=393608 RepID=A0A7C9EYF9_OPUST